MSRPVADTGLKLGAKGKMSPKNLPLTAPWCNGDAHPRNQRQVVAIKDDTNELSLWTRHVPWSDSGRAERSEAAVGARGRV